MKKFWKGIWAIIKWFALLPVRFVMWIPSCFAKGGVDGIHHVGFGIDEPNRKEEYSATLWKFNPGLGNFRAEIRKSVAITTILLLAAGATLYVWATGAPATTATPDPSGEIAEGGEITVVRRVGGWSLFDLSNISLMNWDWGWNWSDQPGAAETLAPDQPNGGSSGSKLIDFSNFRLFNWNWKWSWSGPVRSQSAASQPQPQLAVASPIPPPVDPPISATAAPSLPPPTPPVTETKPAAVAEEKIPTSGRACIVYWTRRGEDPNGRCDP